ncbi:MAG: 2-oxoglutarate dehydrogenase complex dihydrolipoyllysine-residue succinyltransferase [Gammaproteobacteria bacterium]|nr:2-oxoglutarate dehydrogenase complex dihydrolipoyllysine-residue succinyltransferase [Gammaproteobacteria bacterium]
MSIEIKVPNLPESVSEATVANWYRKAGESVKRDENLVDLETDKVMLEVPAVTDGTLKEIRIKAGATVKAGEVIGVIEEGATAAVSPAAGKAVEKSVEKTAVHGKRSSAEVAVPATAGDGHVDAEAQSPAVRKLLAELDLLAADIPATGKGGRLTREDVIAYAEHRKRSADASGQPAVAEIEKLGAPAPVHAGAREEQRVPMTRIRARIAERLKDAQNTAAMLTTFNEVDLGAVSDIRARHKTAFEKATGVKLGFMSFFVKAAVEALKKYPVVNASIDGSDIVFHGYYDIGIAVSSERGLVVPILRDADLKSFAEVEKAIAEFGNRARTSKLTLDDLTGGTFSITNGGVFGSMLSTPILNPPQGAILGMHGITERAVVVDGQVVVRPMMYLALTYDHRLIDGRDAVLFLRHIKEALEDPARLLLEF